jgi:HD-GYP domain-containing protein (c-di-GMP phosphodiesterase class II)
MLQKVENKLDSSQLRELENFGSRINKLGLNFAVCEPQGKVILLCEGDKFKSGEQLINNACRSVVEETSNGEKKNSDRFLTVVLRAADEVIGVALVDFGEESTNSGESEKIQPCRFKVLISEMLNLLADNFQHETKAREQIEMVSAELAQVYEELVLLHKLSINMKVTESDTSFLQMACDSLTSIVNVEGIAILLERNIENERQLVMAAGSGLIDIDQHTAVVLKNWLVDEINSGKEALLDSEVDSPFKYDWPSHIKNIVVVPLLGKAKHIISSSERVGKEHSIIGMLLAINSIDKPDFDSTDAKLFNSVANGCAVFIENDKLFRDLRELFIGSLKALTSSIDAKDQYTRGHSQRVAFISKWIAEKVSEREPMAPEQIHKIYLAGLLHDIGKMGVDESVLRKRGALTKRELECIKTHPSIGAEILGEIKQMRDIVPGVLCHHERIDGTGYPSGLVGDQIPQLGKIVGLADSFDAMTSKRTYRGAMTVEEALAEIEKGLGTQFDEEIARIFIESDVYRLWDIMQDEVAEIYGTGNLSEYGAVAVGTLIR